VLAKKEQRQRSDVLKKTRATRHNLAKPSNPKSLNGQTNGIKNGDKQMKKIFIFLAVLHVAVLAQTLLTDPRDNKTYKTTKIGSQVWLAENLNYNASGSKCYDNKESNCQKYGRLYNWSTATKACPSGWHLPSDAEWDILMATVGDRYTAGEFLKAKNGWNYNNDEGISGNGTDAYGFVALPSGLGRYDGNFRYVGDVGHWWSSSATEGSTYDVYVRFMLYNGKSVGRSEDHKDDNLFSVRCVKN